VAWTPQRGKHSPSRTQRGKCSPGTGCTRCGRSSLVAKQVTRRQRHPWSRKHFYAWSARLGRFSTPCVRPYGGRYNLVHRTTTTISKARTCFIPVAKVPREWRKHSSSRTACGGRLSILRSRRRRRHPLSGRSLRERTTRADAPFACARRLVPVANKVVVCHERVAPLVCGSERRGRGKKKTGESTKWHCLSCSRRPYAIYTTWVALSDASPHDSVLAVAPGSHLSENWAVPHKGMELPSDFDVDESLWVIPDVVKPGDIVIFNIKTVHASSANDSSPRRYRVRCEPTGSDGCANGVGAVVTRGLPSRLTVWGPDTRSAKRLLRDTCMVC